MSHSIRDRKPLIVFAILAAVLATGARAQDSPIPEKVLERILAKAAKPGIPHDEPDRAESYYSEQRLPAGRQIDPVKLYRKAQDRMASLPRYTTRSGLYLPSLRDEARRPLAKAGEVGTWEFLGPGNIGGRTRALLIHPTAPRIRWAAGVSGGVWKTENGGATWRPLADLLPNIAVSTMAMDPNNPDVIYAGTGEGFFREEVRETSLPLRGAGIFKTTNGGATWSRLDDTRNSNFRWVSKIVISHADPRRLYAATRTGVFRSRNAGNTWTRTLASDVKGGCLDLGIRTDRPAADIVFAACGTFEQATVYRNARANGAAPWLPVLSEEGMGRTSLAIAPSNQNVVYALSASYLPGPGGTFQGGLHAVFRSDRSGLPGSWEAVVRNDDPVKLNTLLLTNPVGANIVTCNFGPSDFNSTLGWYANVIAVDPLDPDIVFAGGIDLFRSDDGGRNWGPISYWWDSPPSTHADQHVIAFHPRFDGVTNRTMFVGGDGGVWMTQNSRALKATGEMATCDPNNSSVNWRSLNHNYGVTQFYHGAAFPDGERFVGGTQDNGTLFGWTVTGTDRWFGILGGDGGYVAIDPRNPNIVYAESQGLALAKSTNGGQSFDPATTGITDPDSGATIDDNGDFLFIVPFVMDPSDSDRLYLGGRRLWRTINATLRWDPASARWASGGRMSAVAVAPTDPERVVLGLNDGTIHYTDQALASGENTEWASVRPRAGFVSSVAFDPTDANRVYATYATFGGKHVWSSADGGATWRQIDGNGPRRLPNLPAHSILADPANPDRLFVGTDLGVFVSTSRGLRWAVERTGFANAVTESLEIVNAGGKAWLFAFTHGRGAWRVEMGSQ